MKTKVNLKDGWHFLSQDKLNYGDSSYFFICCVRDQKIVALRGNIYKDEMQAVADKNPPPRPHDEELLDTAEKDWNDKIYSFFPDKLVFSVPKLQSDDAIYELDI